MNWVASLFKKNNGYSYTSNNCSNKHTDKELSNTSSDIFIIDSDDIIGNGEDSLTICKAESIYYDELICIPRTSTDKFKINQKLYDNELYIIFISSIDYDAGSIYTAKRESDDIYTVTKMSSIDGKAEGQEITLLIEGQTPYIYHSFPGKTPGDFTYKVRIVANA